MKEKLIAVAVFAAASIAVAAPKATSYAGHWKLDAQQSKDLPKYYANVKSHELDVTQDDKQLDVAVQVSVGENAPEKLDFRYALDGSETKSASKIRTPEGLTDVPTTLKAVVQADGKLLITIAREIPMPDGPIRATTTELWDLSADGKTLTIHREDETPRGTRKSEMVFVR